MENQIQLPVHKLKPYQLKQWNNLLDLARLKTAVLVWPAGSLKAQMALSLLIAIATTSEGEYFYSTNNPVDILEYIPPSLIAKEKPLTLYNGSVIYSEPKENCGGVFIDYQLQDRCTLNLKFALYIGTPAGMGNHFYELTLQDVYLNVLTYKDCNLSIDNNLSDLRIQQDYFCDFAAGNQLQATKMSQEEIQDLARAQFQIAVASGEKWAIEAALVDFKAPQQEPWELKIHHVDTKPKAQANT